LGHSAACKVYPEVGLTRQIIGSAYEVFNVLGKGFLEKVYTRALGRELKRKGIGAALEVTIDVHYKGEVVGLYYADLVIGNIICEIKVADRLLPAPESHLLNYLKATGKKVGLLINFGGSSVRVKRMVN